MTMNEGMVLKIIVQEDTFNKVNNMPKSDIFVPYGWLTLVSILVHNKQPVSISISKIRQGHHRPIREEGLTIIEQSIVKRQGNSTQKLDGLLPEPWLVWKILLDGNHRCQVFKKLYAD